LEGKIFFVHKEELWDTDEGRTSERDSTNKTRLSAQKGERLLYRISGRARGTKKMTGAPALQEVGVGD